MNTWLTFIEAEQKQAYLQETLAFVAAERAAGKTIYPAEKDVFNAFITPSFENVKVVIIGQDPYHGENQAHGLSFSVLPGIKPPPSLVNIYKELATDIAGFQIPEHGYLQSWAEQGVLLLNAVLTVAAGLPNSHQQLGWEKFTDKAIQLLNDRGENIIFILWGAHAQKKGKKINRDKHHVLSGPHPSPLSAYRGFFGCRHFSQTNQLLVNMGKTPINWQV